MTPISAAKSSAQLVVIATCCKPGLKVYEHTADRSGPAGVGYGTLMMPLSESRVQTWFVGTRTAFRVMLGGPGRGYVHESPHKDGNICV